MIVIEKNIDLPEEGDYKTKPYKYPFDKMEIGDSFYLEDYEKFYRSLQGSAFRYGKKYETQFKVRKEKTGSRCWRVK